MRLLAAASALLWATSGYAQPINNPVLDAFPVDSFYIKGKEFGDYSWTSSINWSTVYDVTTDLTSAPFNLSSNVTKDDLPPNHPNADHDDFATVAGTNADDLALVNQAISILSGAGGGVLYFPAGVYIFSDDIELQDGVVLRGADPVGVTDARTSGYNPGTDFFFPRMPGIVTDNDVPVYKQRLSPAAVAASTAIGGAYTDPSDEASKIDINKKIEIEQTYPNGLTASNYGIVNVDIMRAAIQFLQEERMDGTFDRFSVTFGTDDKNRMEGGNVVVFGCRVNNATDLEWLLIQDADFNTWQAWPSRAAPHIDVMVKQNSIIANNRVNDMDFDFRNGSPVDTTPGSLLLVDSFGMAISGDNNGGETDYTNPANIYLDRSGNALAGGASGLLNSNNGYATYRFAQGIGIASNRSSRVGFGGSGPSNPAGEPTLQRQGVVVRQNWVFVSARVGYSLSGFGLEARDNVREDINGDVYWIDSDGRRQNATAGQTTLENRGFDVSGDNIFVNNNDIEVYRRNIRGNGPSNDGEGILIQQNDGQKPINNWTITNNTVSGGNAYIGLFKLESMRNVNISNNTVASQNIQVQANPNFRPGLSRDLTINNNTSVGISITAGLLDISTTTVITNNTLTGGSSITVPDYSNSLLFPATLNNDIHYLTWGNSTGLTFDKDNAGLPGGAGDFPFDNEIDPAPKVTIISPAPGEALPLGNYTLQVKVETSGSNPLDSVVAYDGSQLLANQQIQDFAHRTDPQALLGATALTLNGATGYYEGTWNVTQEFLDYGLLTVEAVMTSQTVINGVGPNDPAITSTFADNTFALVDIEEGVSFTTGDPQIVIASGTDPTLSFDMAPGGTYMLQKRNSLTSGEWEFVSGQIVSNGNAKAVGALTDAGALPGDSETFYRVVER